MAATMQAKPTQDGASMPTIVSTWGTAITAPLPRAGTSRRPSWAGWRISAPTAAVAASSPKFTRDHSQRQGGQRKDHDRAPAVRDAHESERQGEREENPERRTATEQLASQAPQGDCCDDRQRQSERSLR